MHSIVLQQDDMFLLELVFLRRPRLIHRLKGAPPNVYARWWCYLSVEAAKQASESWVMGEDSAPTGWVKASQPL